MTKSELITIRESKPGDINLIYASWLRGLFYGESWFSLIPKNTFMEHYHKVIEFIIKKPDTTIKIACLKDDENTILGYSVYTNDTLHWCFVKKQWRNIGICKDLVPKDIKVVTHLTKTGLSLIRKRDIAFNPFLI